MNALSNDLADSQAELWLGYRPQLLQSKAVKPADTGALRIRGYARFSAAGGKETSIERQIEMMQEYALTKLGCELSIDDVYVDRGISGRSLVDRIALADMQNAAVNGEFDILLFELLDRLSRGLEHTPALAVKMMRKGIQLHSTSYGRQLTTIDIAIGSYISDEFIESFRTRVHGGRIAAARKGKRVGIRAWAYSMVLGKPGDCVIDELLRQEILDLFSARAAGASIHGLAVALNKRGIISPRKKKWTARSVKTVLENELYAGWAVFGKTRSTYDPEERKSDIVRTPSTEWIVAEVPHLRIVDLDTWRAVRALDARPTETVPRGRKPGSGKTILSMRIRCHVCGGRMLVGSSGHKDRRDYRYLACSARTLHACDNARTIRLDWLETALAGLVRGILDEASYEERYLRDLKAEHERDVSVLEKRRERLCAELKSVDDKIMASFDTDLMAGYREEHVLRRRNQMNSRHADLQQQLAALPSSLVSPVIDLEGLLDLRQAFDGFVRRNSEGEANGLVAEADALATLRLKNLIVGTQCIPLPGSQSFKIILDLRVGRDVHGPNGAFRSGMRRLECIHHPTDRGAVKSDEAEVRQLLNASEWQPTDAVAEFLQSHVPDWLVERHAVPMSVIVRALYFVIMTGVSRLHMIAAVGPDGPLVDRVIIGMLRSGHWAELWRSFRLAYPELAARATDRSIAQFQLQVERGDKKRVSGRLSQRLKRSAQRDKNARDTHTVGAT